MTLQSMHYRKSAPELLFFNLFIFLSACASQKRLCLITHMKKYMSAKTDELNHYALKGREIVHCKLILFKLEDMIASFQNA